MKLICTQENLSKALNIIGRVANKNTTLPILNNVLLKTEKNGLKLSSTNLELGIDCWVGGKIIDEGEITIPTKLFFSFVSNLPNGNIEIKSEKDNLNIRCGGYKTNIRGLSAKEYPLIPKIKSNPIFKVEGNVFKNALLQTMPSVSNSESRMEIMGIFMDISQLKNNKVILVATDGYRLTEKTVNLKRNNVNVGALEILGGTGSVIIPKNTAQELIKDLGEDGGLLEVIISENQILFKFGNINMISRLIEGKYPDYKQIIPNKFESSVSIGTNKIISAIKAASLFANTSNNGIEFILRAGQELEINSEANEVGNNNVKIPAEIKGKDLNVRYNYKYLIDGLNSVFGESVVLNINNEDLPTTLTSVEDGGFICVIMPIRG